MPLPFKVRPHLPDNKKLALARLKHLKRKLDRDPKFKNDYVKFMEGVFKDDAEKVDTQSEPGKIWYIPHQGVYHPRKPDKIRVVFDCSARFHVSKEDRDHLRFLWWENGDTNSEPTEYRMKVHLFGASSSPEKMCPSAASFIRKHFYVDDGLISVKSVGFLAPFILEGKRVLQEMCQRGMGWDEPLPKDLKSRWRKEYLSNIALRQQWHAPRRNMDVGDIVILKEEDIPRNEWKLAKVVEAHEDDDGLVRKVTVQIGERKLGKKGERLNQPSIVQRPIQKLVVLVKSS
ncbi:hypothetical protein MHYP_G00174360 [Metynnis hypsauchen]